MLMMIRVHKTLSNYQDIAVGNKSREFVIDLVIEFFAIEKAEVKRFNILTVRGNIVHGILLIKRK